MKLDLQDFHPEIAVQILGVNAAGAEEGNPYIEDGMFLPWLQDTYEDDVWGLWQVSFRDVIILDGQNRLFAVYNLTDNNLLDPASYQELYSLLVAAAGAP